MPTVTQIFGNKTSVKILRVLFSTPGRAMKPDELTNLLNTGRGNSYKALSELAKSGILKKEKARKTILYSLNKANAFYGPLKDIFNMEKKTISGHWNKINSIEDFVEELKKAQLGDFSITLFGSVARGTDTPKSDVDLLVETSEKNAKKVLDAATKIRERTEVPLNVTIGTLDELKAKNRELFENVLKEGVKIYGY